MLLQSILKNTLFTIFTFTCFYQSELNAGEKDTKSATEAAKYVRTPLFADEKVARTYIGFDKPHLLRKPVTGIALSDSIVFNQLEIFKILSAHYPYSLEENYHDGLVGSPIIDAITYDATDILHYLINEKQIQPQQDHIKRAERTSKRKALEILLQVERAASAN